MWRRSKAVNTIMSSLLQPGDSAIEVTRESKGALGWAIKNPRSTPGGKPRETTRCHKRTSVMEWRRPIVVTKFPSRNSWEGMLVNRPGGLLHHCLESWAVEVRSAWEEKDDWFPVGASMTDLKAPWLGWRLQHGQEPGARKKRFHLTFQN